MVCSCVQLKGFVMCEYLIYESCRVVMCVCLGRLCVNMRERGLICSSWATVRRVYLGKDSSVVVMSHIQVTWNHSNNFNPVNGVKQGEYYLQTCSHCILMNCLID